MKSLLTGFQVIGSERNSASGETRQVHDRPGPTRYRPTLYRPIVGAEAESKFNDSSAARQGKPEAVRYQLADVARLDAKAVIPADKNVFNLVTAQKLLADFPENALQPFVSVENQPVNEVLPAVFEQLLNLFFRVWIGDTPPSQEFKKKILGLESIA